MDEWIVLASGVDFTADSFFDFQSASLADILYTPTAIANQAFSQEITTAGGLFENSETVVASNIKAKYVLYYQDAVRTKTVEIEFRLNAGELEFKTGNWRKTDNENIDFTLAGQSASDRYDDSLTSSDWQSATGARHLDLLTVRTQSPITRVDKAIGNLNTFRSTLGASHNRLNYAVDNLTNVAQNTQSAQSRVLDTDYATETTGLARTQILQQAATAMIAQANTQAQSVLTLLS